MSKKDPQIRLFWFSLGFVFCTFVFCTLLFLLEHCSSN